MATFFYNITQIINEIMRDRLSRKIIKGAEARLLRSVAGNSSLKYRLQHPLISESGQDLHG
jgi:hypothetical protein